MRFWQYKISLLAVLVGAAAIIAPASSAAAYNESRPVLAYYYAWWDASNFGRTLFQPGEAYNSDDVGVMQRHVQQAQSAGIDGFVMSWYGNGDRTDANLAHLLDIAQKSNFRATIHFETPKFGGPDDVVAQLQAFYQNRLNHPSIVRYQGSAKNPVYAPASSQWRDRIAEAAA